MMGTFGVNKVTPVAAAPVALVIVALGAPVEVLEAPGPPVAVGTSEMLVSTVGEVIA